MSTERELLQELITRAERLSEISAKIDEYSKSLGTDQGPKRLNYHEMSGQSRSDVMVQVGSLHRRITTLVLPKLDRKLDEIVDQLEPQLDVMLQRRFRIEEINQFVTDGYLPPDALELAMQDMNEFKQAEERDYRRGLITRRELVYEMLGKLSEERPDQVKLVKPKEDQPSVQAPTEPEQPPISPIEPEELSPEAEVERLPAVLVNRVNRETKVNNKENKYSKLLWEVLINIIQAGEEGILNQDLEKAVKKAHPKLRSHMSPLIFGIRCKLEDDPNNPKVITTSREARRGRYFFKAEVQYASSRLVIFEGRNRIFVDNRDIELTSEEMALLKVLIDKVGEVVNSRTISAHALGIEDPVAARLRFKMADLVKKINYPYGDKLIDSRITAGHSGYKLQNVELATEKETRQFDAFSTLHEILAEGRKKVPGETPAEESEEEKRVKVLADIAEIQRIVDSGIPINPTFLKKAQEMAKQVGGLIEPLEDLEGEIDFDEEEQAVLARFIEDLNREPVEIDKNLKLSLLFEPGTLDSCRRLVDFYLKNNSERVNDDLNFIREKIIIKLERIFKDEKADDKIAEFKGDFGMILFELFITDRLVIPSRLMEFLLTRVKRERYSDEVASWVKKIKKVQEESEHSPQAVSELLDRPIKFEFIEDTPKPQSETLTNIEQKIRVSNLREESFLVINMILENINMSADEVLDAMGKTKDGRRYSWIQAVNSMVRMVGVLNERIQRGGASEVEIKVLNGIKELVSKPDEGDIKQVMLAWKDELIKWFKEHKVAKTDDASETPKFRKLSKEELAELDAPKNTKSEIKVTTEADQSSISGERYGGPMNTRQFRKYANARGFQIVSGRGDLKVVDPNGNFVCSIPSNRAGGRSMSTGTYRAAIRKIDERIHSINGSEENNQ